MASSKRRTAGKPRREVGTGSKPKKSFLVVSEGERTEVQYLNYWAQQYRDGATLKIDEMHGRSPSKLVGRAVDIKRKADRAARREGSSYDSVWCVFDRDDFPDIQEAMQKARANGIKVAFSNPCFEIWIVLHFEDRTRYSDRHEVQSASRNLLLCEKSLTPEALSTLEASYWEAKERAQELEKRHFGNGSGIPDNNPGTTIWQLIDEIRQGVVAE